MPAVFPLRGLRYAPAFSRQLSRLVCPPYDVISPADQAALYRRSPYNFVRIIYGRGRATDRPGRDRYSRARETFLDWWRRGILRRDPQPGCYPYRQRFVHQGRPYDRWGILALIRLGDPTIFLHEETSEAPKRDRLQLLQAVQANLSPIFGLVEDSDHAYRQLLASSATRAPLASALFDEVQHDLWRVTSPRWLHRLQAALAAKALLLADGHHRYEVALHYCEVVRQSNGRWSQEHPSNFMLADIAAFDAEDPGILQTHRVFGGLPAWTLERLAAVGRSWLIVQPVPDEAALQMSLDGWRDDERPAIGCYLAGGERALVTLAQPDPAVGLDVELLHRVIVPRGLAPTPEAAGRLFVHYHQSWAQAVRQVDRGHGGLAWCLRPPTLAQILRCVRDGRRLPQKSTYFIPKPLAGLVVHRLQPVGVPPRQRRTAIRCLAPTEPGT